MKKLAIIKFKKLMELPPTQQTSQEDELYQRAMESMFNQISTQLKYLFKNLNYIYKVHGISYNLANFHGYMLRVLLPPQVLSFIHFWCPNENFKTKALQMLDLSYVVNLEQKRKPSQMNIIRHKIRDGNMGQEQPINNEKNQKEEEHKIQEPFQLQKQGNQSPEGELKLYKWVIQQIQRGNQLTRLDLIKQAVINGQIVHLSGSSRWCKKFLTRFRQLKNYVKKDPPGMQQDNKQKISQLISQVYKRKQQLGLQQFQQLSSNQKNLQKRNKNPSNLYIQDQYQYQSNQASQSQSAKQPFRAENLQKEEKQPQYYEQKDQKPLYALCQEAEPHDPYKHTKLQEVYHNKPVDIGQQYLQKLKNNLREMRIKQMFENQKKTVEKVKINIGEMKSRYLQDSYRPPQSDSEFLNAMDSDWSEQLQQASYQGRLGQSSVKENSQVNDNRQDIPYDPDRIYVENKYLDNKGSSK